MQSIELLQEYEVQWSYFHIWPIKPTRDLV